MLYAVVHSSSDGSVITSSFMDDVMFWYKRANGSESQTVHMFWPVLQLAAPARRQTTLFGQVRHADVVSDCILLYKKLIFKIWKFMKEYCKPND